ncbi:MAG: hypothetical protein ACP5N1_04600 [Candidatus Woesearchaeota archaeon]
MESKTIEGIGKDFNATKKQVKSEFTKMKNKIGEVQHLAEKYIEENPKKATAIATGLGVVIGAAITAYWMREKSNHNINDEKETARETVEQQY